MKIVRLSLIFFLFTNNIFAKDMLSCESPTQVKLSFVINDEKNSNSEWY